MKISWISISRENHWNFHIYLSRQFFTCRGFFMLTKMSTVQFSCSVMSDSTIPLTAPRQTFLSITNYWILLKLMSIELVMPSNHLIFFHPLLFLPLVFPSSRIFSMSQFFASGGQSIGVSASTSVLRWIFKIDFLSDGLVWSPCTKGLSSIFFNTTVQKHQVFGTQASL